MSQHNSWHKAMENAHWFSGLGDYSDVKIVRSLTIRVSHGPKGDFWDIDWSKADMGGGQFTFGVSFDTTADTAWVNSLCVTTEVAEYHQGVPLEAGHGKLHQDYNCGGLLLFRLVGFDGNQTVATNFRVIE